MLLHDHSAGGGKWQWQDVEPRTRPGQVIIFGGELLGWLTAGAIRPVHHRVVTSAPPNRAVDANEPPGGHDDAEEVYRISMPCFMLPWRSALLEVVAPKSGGATLRVASAPHHEVGASANASLVAGGASRGGLVRYEELHRLQNRLIAYKSISGMAGRMDCDELDVGACRIAPPRSHHLVRASG
jgi:hypothetical protein